PFHGVCTMARPAIAVPIVLILLSPLSAPAQPEKIQLTLRPAAAPVPALKYQLLPDVCDQTPGNAMLLYDKIFAPAFITVPKAMEDEISHPLFKQRDVPGKEMRWVLDSAKLRELDVAARRESCYWPLIPRLRQEDDAFLREPIPVMRLCS